MPTFATPLNILWLTAPKPTGVTLGADREGLAKTLIALPEGAGQDSIETMELPLGMTLCRVVHGFAPGPPGALVAMSEVVGALTEPVFFVQALGRGRGELHDRHLDVRLAHRPEVCVFEHIDRIDHVHLADPSESVAAIALTMAHSALRALLGDASAQTLLLRLGLTNAPAAAVLPVPAHIRTMLTACFPQHLTGNLLRLHAQSRVLDFMVALHDHFAGPLWHTPPRRLAIAALRRELDALDGRLPSLAELASRYGLSERVMNQAFRQEYGQSIVACITDLRLQDAHAALTGSDTPLKVLAARLGYSSVHHFSNAFTRRFGVRPGKLRQKSRMNQKATDGDRGHSGRRYRLARQGSRGVLKRQLSLLSLGGDSSSFRRRGRPRFLSSRRWPVAASI